MADAYIIDAVRTPRGRGKKGKGALTEIHPQELLAQTLQELARRTEVDPADVDDVVVGAVSQVGEQGANIARNAVLAADWPLHVAGVSLNRFCGSGLQAVNFAAMGVMGGAQELVVGGGVESMSRVPMGSDGGEGDGINPHLRRRHAQVPQGISADLIATLEGFTREELDAFALRSQQRAAEAQRECRFARALFAVRDPETGAVALEKDEYLRPETTLEALAGLSAAFEAAGATPAGPDGETLDELALARFPREGGIRHLHTAGNSSGIVDGAAAVLLASDEYVRGHGLRPRARIRSMATFARGPGDHAHRPRRDGTQGAAQGGDAAGGHRPVGDQRGVRRRAAADHPPPGDRSRAGERERRRHRAGPPARRHGRHAARHRAGRAGAPRPGDGADHALHRRRAGRRDGHRARLTGGWRWR